MIYRFKNNLLLATLIVAFIAAITNAQSPQTTLRSVDGRTVNLNDLKGKTVVLSFGGTWLPMASKELPALQKIADRYVGRGVEVYWVSLNSTKSGTRNYAADADIQAFAQKHGLRVTILRDPEQAVYKGFELDAVPTVLVLNKLGKVAHKYVGFGADQSDYSEIVRDLDQILK